MFDKHSEVRNNHPFLGEKMFREFLNRVKYGEKIFVHPEKGAPAVSATIIGVDLHAQSLLVSWTEAGAVGTYRPPTSHKMLQIDAKTAVSTLKLPTVAYA